MTLPTLRLPERIETHIGSGNWKTGKTNWYSDFVSRRKDARWRDY